jgi:hypothetical protein
MDPAYESYFANRIAQVRRIGPTAILPFARTVRPTRTAFSMVSDAIPDAEAEARSSGSVLRGDAQLLLVLAFQELVARPVDAVRPGSTGDLSASIRGDILTITQSAIRRNEGRDVSAHAIVDSTSELWSQLRTASWGLWDSSPG